MFDSLGSLASVPALYDHDRCEFGLEAAPGQDLAPLRLHGHDGHEASVFELGAAATDRTVPALDLLGGHDLDGNRREKQLRQR